MALPPNASVTDVINKLSELEGINQKTELASVIGAPATSTDTVAQQVTKLQEAKNLLSANIISKGVNSSNTEPILDLAEKISEIDTGQFHFSAGTATTGGSDSTLYFQLYNSTTSVSSAFISVSGINFKPKRVYIYPDGEISGISQTIFSESIGNSTDFVSVTIISVGQSTNTTSIGYKANAASAYVNESGFRLPVPNTHTNYRWVAYES